MCCSRGTHMVFTSGLTYHCSTSTVKLPGLASQMSSCFMMSAMQQIPHGHMDLWNACSDCTHTTLRINFAVASACSMKRHQSTGTSLYMQHGLVGPHETSVRSVAYALQGLSSRSLQRKHGSGSPWALPSCTPASGSDPHSAGGLSSPVSQMQSCAHNHMAV